MDALGDNMNLGDHLEHDIAGRPMVFMMRCTWTVLILSFDELENHLNFCCCHRISQSFVLA